MNHTFSSYPISAANAYTSVSTEYLSLINYRPVTSKFSFQAFAYFSGGKRTVPFGVHLRLVDT